MNGCNNCKYAKYDHDTGFYNCSKEDLLTEKDTDDLTETGGANCSQWQEENEIINDQYYDQLLNRYQA